MRERQPSGRPLNSPWEAGWRAHSDCGKVPEDGCRHPATHTDSGRNSLTQGGVASVPFVGQGMAPGSHGVAWAQRPVLAFLPASFSNVISSAWLICDLSTVGGFGCLGKVGGVSPEAQAAAVTTSRSPNLCFSGALSYSRTAKDQREEALREEGGGFQASPRTGWLRPRECGGAEWPPSVGCDGDHQSVCLGGRQPQEWLSRDKRPGPWELGEAGVGGEPSHGTAA